MLTFPQINPVAIAVGPLQVHWYGLMYLLAFTIAWYLAKYRIKQQHLLWTEAQLSDLFFYAAIGVILGGRLGYMLFYALPLVLKDPLIIFKIWQGGMSFHGGFLGVLIALYYASRRFNLVFLDITDFVVPLVPLGLGFGRIGNFINGELWGRVTHLPWAMVFTHVDLQPRHPSQIYEFILEGLLLFSILWIYSNKKRPQGRVTAAFLIGYAVLRWMVEYVRQPDTQVGLIMHAFTMGQILSIPLFLTGYCLWIRKR